MTTHRTIRRQIERLSAAQIHVVEVIFKQEDLRKTLDGEVCSEVDGLGERISEMTSWLLDQPITAGIDWRVESSTEWRELPNKHQVPVKTTYSFFFKSKKYAALFRLFFDKR